LNRLITFAFLLILSGCASSSFSVVQPFKGTYKPDEKIGIVQFTTKHAGLSGDVNTAPPGITLVAYIVGEDGGGEDYAKELDNEIFKGIEHNLNQNSSISFSKSPNRELLVADNIAPVSMQAFSVENDLAYMVTIDVNYTSGIGLTKPVALIINWRIFDHFGNKIGEVETIENTEDTFDVFPNSMDTRYREPYLSLVKPSVERFVSYLTKVDNL
jgi:hypothetical protein